METHIIKRKCVTEGTKTLGVVKAADLNQKGEYKHLLYGKPRSSLRH
jgi:hypothetical protein